MRSGLFPVWLCGFGCGLHYLKEKMREMLIKKSAIIKNGRCKDLSAVQAVEYLLFTMRRSSTPNKVQDTVNV